MTRVPFLLSCLFALLLGVAAPAQTLQLADGQVLLAKVDDATGDGLVVTRLINGGTLELRWEDLTPECQNRIKKQFALVAEDEGELTTSVNEVRYELNGQPQSVIGKIVANVPGQPLVVQVKGRQIPIPRAAVLNVLPPVEVPVTQIFTRDEFYALALQKADPGESSDKHLLLAEDLIKVRDYEHAKQHLDKAKELGNSADAQRLQQTSERLQRYQTAQKELELLDQIQIARRRGGAPDFERGLKLIAEFESTFPQSKLKGEFEQEKKRFQDARDRFLTYKVAEEWRRSIRTIAERKTAEAGFELQNARDYAEQKMTDDIAAYVAQRLKIEESEVRSLWAAREKYPQAKRPEHFTYGIGSWVLGQAAVLKGTKTGQQKDDAPKDAAQERELERIARAIQKAMEARRAAAQGQGQGQRKEQTEEEWWDEASRAEQVNWLRAYYAEFGGQLVVASAYVSPCVICGGIGEMSELGPNNKIVKVQCYLCHATKYVRTLRAW